MNEKPYTSIQVGGSTVLFRRARPVLATLDIELTERCNNSCAHCYINLPKNDPQAKKKELSTDEIKNILKEPVSLGCLTVRFTGGEPLLRKDFAELYVFARKSGLKVIIFTNAALITPDLADLFARIPPREHIEITMYGMKKKSYEAVTLRRGSFEMARRGIDLLLKRKTPFVVKWALLPANRHEIGAFESWSETIPWMQSPPSYSMFFDLRCRNTKKKNRHIKELRLSPEDGLGILTRRKDNYIKQMKEFCRRFMHPPGVMLFSCGSGLRGGCVDAYGKFQPCLLLRHPDTVYDLKNGSLEDALTRFFPSVRGIRAANPEYLKRCARCFLKGLCEQCPAKSWSEYGALDTPVEYLCRIAHTQARFLGLIDNNENAWEVSDWKGRINNFVNS
jgi:radical SAM protein with 4Fe4S-binding SPASM domain